MANIVKWFDPATADRFPLRMIAIDWTKDRDAIVLRAAKQGDNPEEVFDPTSQLGDLWQTLKLSGHNISATNLILFGNERDETGRFAKIEAAIRNERRPEYGFAYKPEQLAAFLPKNLFMGANLRLHGQPWFSCSLNPYEGKSRTPRVSNALPKPAVVRMSAAPATGVKRQRAG